MMNQAEFIQLALACSEAEFVERYPFFFLIGQATLVSPRSRVGATAGAMDDTNPGGWGADYTEVPAPDAPVAGTLQVFVIRKANADLPTRLSVGRADSNDVILDDVSISKRHAYFAILDGRVELADAGSLVGTWVNDLRLGPSGDPHIVKPGDVIRLAHHEFCFVEARTCWARLHDLDGELVIEHEEGE